MADVTTLTEANEERLLVLKDCMARLAMHFLILNLQTQVRQQGLVAEEKLVEGGTIIRLNNIDATMKYVEGYLCEAREICGEWYVLDSPAQVEFTA